MTNSLTAAQATDWLDENFGDARVMAVLRGFDPIETVRLANVAWDLGCTHVEVPIETRAALPALTATLRAGAARGRLVGAGTIVTANQLFAAVDAGAAYVVSPGLDPQLIERAHARGIPFLPGVATATEILRARSLGLTWLKAFPASLLGLPWFGAMHGPFPDVSFIATGGVNASNARAILDSGARIIGIGSILADEDQHDLIASLVHA